MKSNTAKEPLSVPQSLANAFQANDQAVMERVMERAVGVASELTADLYDVARSVFLADCKQARTSSWRRVLPVSVAVRRLDVWQREEVKTALDRVLSFAGGDAYTFTWGSAAAISHPTTMPLDFGHDTTVCLCSDGMDSAGGLCRCLAEKHAIHVLAVSGLTQYQVMGRIGGLIGSVNERFGNRVVPVPFPLYRNGYRQRGREEPSQRSRSFLLLAAGAIVALMSGRNRVEVYENGIEMCNFPLEPFVMGDRRSRAMNPILLSRMADFMTALTGSPFEFAAPSALLTKAEAFRVAGLVHNEILIKRTVSCVHMRGRPCGGCSGCILRLQALAFNGNTDTLKYAFDLFTGRGLSLTSTRCENFVREAYTMDHGMHRLRRALSSDTPFRELLKLSGIRFSDRDGFVAAIARVSGSPLNQIEERLVDLYSRHAKEWDEFRPLITFLPQISDENKEAQAA